MIRTLSYILSTGFGIGYVPRIPGTAGSLTAVILFWLLPFPFFIWLAVSVVVFFTGVWSGNIVEKDAGKDPGFIIIDEITGQWFALIFLPKILWVVVSAFILFRIMDIVKPFPANRIESLPGGWGIMLDDLVAAVYANLLLYLIIIIMNSNIPGKT